MHLILKSELGKRFLKSHHISYREAFHTFLEFLEFSYSHLVKLVSSKQSRILEFLDSINDKSPLSPKLYVGSSNYTSSLLFLHVSEKRNDGSILRKRQYELFMEFQKQIDSPHITVPNPIHQNVHPTISNAIHRRFELTKSAAKKATKPIVANAVTPLGYVLEMPLELNTKKRRQGSASKNAKPPKIQKTDTVEVKTALVPKTTAKEPKTDRKQTFGAQALVHKDLESRFSFTTISVCNLEGLVNGSFASFGLYFKEAITKVQITKFLFKIEMMKKLKEEYASCNEDSIASKNDDFLLDLGRSTMKRLVSSDFLLGPTKDLISRFQMKNFEKIVESESLDLISRTHFQSSSKIYKALLVNLNKDDSESFDLAIESAFGKREAASIPPVASSFGVSSTSSPIVIMSNCPKGRLIVFGGGDANFNVTDNLYRILIESALQNRQVNFTNSNCICLQNSHNDFCDLSSGLCCQEYPSMSQLNANILDLKIKTFEKLSGISNIFITSGKSKALKVFDLIVERVLVQLDIDQFTSIAIVEMMTGAYKIWICTSHITIVFRDESSQGVANLLYAIEVAKNLESESSDWQVRINSFYRIALNVSFSNIGTRN